MPLANAAFAEAMVAAFARVCAAALLSLHSLGRPSVDSTMTGGEPFGGGFATKSATTASIACAVGVLPPGGCAAMRSEMALRLLSARAVENTPGHALLGYIAAPKY